MTNHADASRADALATASRNVEMAKKNLRNQMERLQAVLRQVDITPDAEVENEEVSEKPPELPSVLPTANREVLQASEHPLSDANILLNVLPIVNGMRLAVSQSAKTSRNRT